MGRTNSGAVQGILGQDYDKVNAPSLLGYIDSATVIVDRVYTCALNKGITLTSTELELIERWTAAHLYTKSDPTYSSRSTQGRSGSFIRGKDEPEPYKDAAIGVDYSGCLNAILNRKFASATWVGLPPSEQTDYEDRD